MLIPPIVASAWLLIAEGDVQQAEDRLDAQTAAFKARQAPTTPPATLLPSSARPAAFLADALLRARAAAISREPSRRNALLAAASRDAAAIAPARRYWGEAWATIAYVDSLQTRTAPSTPLDLARSYDDAPYLSHAAAWRITDGLRHWADIDRATRSRLVDEAVWFARNNVDSLDSVLAVVRGTPAYEPFMTRWIAARRGDEDFRFVERLSP